MELIQYYEKTTAYVQPAWTEAYDFIDGIYVDDMFFKNNIPTGAAYLGIFARPSSHLVPRNIMFSGLTFRDGVVGYWQLGWSWLIGETNQIYLYQDFPDNFYGMGLNTIHIVASGLGSGAVTYNVTYVLEVHY
jgi:hypothetical protein